MFVRAFRILEWLSTRPAGMTAGELQRACKEFSIGQINRALKELQKEQFVFAERQGGHGFGKIVYTLSHNVAVNCELIGSNFFKQEVA